MSRTTTYHVENVVSTSLVERLNETKHEVIQVLDREHRYGGFWIIQRSRRWTGPDLTDHPPADPDDRSQWYDDE